MATTGKRWSPKNNKSFKMKFSLKKSYAPKKTVKENKHVAVLQKLKKTKGNATKAKQTSPSKPFSFRLKPTASDITTKKAYNISANGSPETPKQTKTMSVTSGDSKKLSPLDATEDAVPSFELCAKFGFTGKKAEVARTLIKVQRAFNRLKFNELPSSSYKSVEFLILFREIAAIGARAVSEFKLWEEFERGIIRLLNMRLAYHKVPAGTLFKYLGNRIALWNKTVYYAGSCHPYSNIKIVPWTGVLRDLVDLAVTLHEQMEAVKELDRVDGVTDFARKAGYY